MTTAEAILANLDDDAPRLVWADQVGGERGELVVVQCRLAGALSDDERRALVAREQELLAAKGLGAELAGLVHSFRFERGFVEHVHAAAAVVAARGAELFAAAPTLRSIDLQPLYGEMLNFSALTTEGYWAQYADTLTRVLAALPPRITTLTVEPTVWEPTATERDVMHSFGDDCARVLAGAPLPGLRTLRMLNSGLGLEGVRRLARPGLVGLDLRGALLGGAGCAAAVRAFPGVRRFGFAEGEPQLHGAELEALLVEPALARLTALDLHLNQLDDADAARLAACPALAGLETLDLRYNGGLTSEGLKVLRRSPFLSSRLELKSGSG